MSIFRSRPARRRALLAAGLAAVVAAGVGVVSGMSPATARQETAQASFRCALPGGGQVDTPVEMGVSLPETATAGTDLVAEPTVKIALPADAVTALRSAGAEIVGGSATANLVLRQGGKDTPLDPAALSAAPVPLQDGVVLVLTGPAVTAKPTAGPAELVLTGLTARLLAGAEGKADQAVDCGAYPGGDTLGTVTVSDSPEQRQQAAQTTPPTTSKPPAPGIRTTFDVEAVNTLAKVGVDIHIAGSLETFIRAVPPPGEKQLIGTLILNDLEKVYLVVFRFMPVFNDIDFSEGTVSGDAVIDFTQNPPVARVNSESRIDLRLENVIQDNKDLKVGDNCTTVRKMVIPLEGEIILVPGQTSEFKTKAALPPFSGCGTEEDLDPLISGLVSGPDNPMTIRLTLKCIENNCAP